MSRLLGHSSVKVTEKAYLDVTDEDIKKRYLKFSPIMTMTGMDESGYKRARKALIDLGWITHRDGMIQVHFDKIRESAASALEGEIPMPPSADPASILPYARKSFGTAKTSSFDDEWN